MPIMETAEATYLENKVRDALHEVKDPEIPKISVVELGIIVDVRADDESNVTVVMTPTFAGCPALNILQEQIKVRAFKVEGVRSAQVEVNYDVQWNTNMITEEGRKKLEEFGIAPPKCYEQPDLDVSMVEDAQCPHCGSDNTTMNTPFGPTLCRSIHYCYDCHEKFEQFKPVG